MTENEKDEGQFCRSKKVDKGSFRIMKVKIHKFKKKVMINLAGTDSIQVIAQKNQMFFIYSC